MNQRESAAVTIRPSSARSQARAVLLSLPARGWLAWLLFGLTCAFAGLDFIFLALSWATSVPDTWGFRGDGAILALAFGIVGQMLARRHPHNPIGWLFLVASLASGTVRFGVEYATYALLTRPGLLPGGSFAAWTASWLWCVMIGAIFSVFLLFPTGRLPSAAWRPAAWFVAGAFVLMTSAFMFRPGPLYYARYLDNPIALTGSDRAFGFFGRVAAVGVGLSAILVGASVILRLRRAKDVERQQIKWFTYATGLMCVIGLINAVGLAGHLPGGGFKPFQFYTFAVWLMIPFTVGVAILRHRLFDIDLVINRTLVYGALTAAIVGLYMGAVGTFGVLVHSGQQIAPLLLASVLTLLILRPLHAGLQRGADRLVPVPARLAAQPAPPGLAATASPPAASNAQIVAAPEPQPARTSLQRLAWPIAWGMFWLSMAVSIAGFGISLLALAQIGGQAWFAAHVWFGPVLTVTFALVGALVAARQPRNPIGWICSAVGVLSGLNSLAFGYRLASEMGLLLPGFQIVYWLDLWVWIPVTFLPLTFLLLLFPNGRLPSARWRPVGWSAGLAIAAFTLSTALNPSPSLEPTATPNPFGIPGAAGVLDRLLILATILIAGGAAGSVAAVTVRFRRSRGMERAQLKWLAYAGVLGLLGNIAIYAWGATQPRDAVSYELMLTGIFAMLMAIAAAAGVAILRHRLYDIDLVINRTLVYGALTGLIVGLYVLLVGASGEVLHQTGSLVLSLLATGLIAVLFQPLRERLQRVVNRVLYGERDDPYAVLSRLGQRLESVLAPEAVLPALAETVAQALKLPYVAVALQSAGASEPQIAAAYGLPMGEAMRLPLTYQSEYVGELRVGPRGPGESFTRAEQRLLEDIAHQAGVAAHAVRLTADLQRSRERLVTTREEERRRLRRDLHDGLGPALAIHSLKVGSARSLLTRDLRALSSLGAVGQDVASADAVLAELEHDIAATLADIRRLVYDLRPPTLDELGLVAAIRESAARYAPATTHNPDTLRITVEAPEHLPALPAAVEVAAFRMTQEALTNVVRYAQARTCRICLRLDDGLWLEIADDGVGVPATRDGHHAGVGLASMRERAAELGGTCTIESPPGGGTRVLAHLPLG